MKWRLGRCLKLFELRFRQMGSGAEPLAEMLGFVSNLGMSQLAEVLHADEFELNVILDSIMIETLKEGYQRQTMDQLGLTSANKKLQKKKLRKKQKQLQTQAREQLTKQENQKKQAIEESRQMQLIDEAEANPLPDKAQLKAIKENQRRRMQQIEEKNMIQARERQEREKLVMAEQVDEPEESKVMRGLRPDSSSEDIGEVGPIPQYPGRQLDPRGASSVLSQRINMNMTQL